MEERDMSETDHRAGRDITEAAFGLAAVATAGTLAAILFAPADVAYRALAMAVTVGVLAALLADWRACAATTIIASLILVGFMAPRFGESDGGQAVWSYMVLIGFAALIGRGQRWMRAAPLPGIR
jgi:hypothetical protein